MIHYNYETDFILQEDQKISTWIKETIQNENHKLGNISYIFCDDKFLLEKNIQYLNHDTLTDIISFDYTDEEWVSGDIFISIERVAFNKNKFKVAFKDELYRVIIHGILHFCGYKDKTKEEKKVMRAKEDYYLSLLKI